MIIALDLYNLNYYIVTDIENHTNLRRSKMEKTKMSMDLLDQLNAFESKIMKEIKSIDSSITTLRERRRTLSMTVRSINPAALRREKKSQSK